MATYNKRGYKAPKPEEVEEEKDNFVDGESTTEDVFNSLDEGASRTEEFIAKYQKLILSVVGVVAVITAGYLLFNKFITEPNEEEASNEMFQAQQYFADATSTTVAADSIFNLALNGGEGKFGFLNIIEKYNGTNAANLAHYYAGVSFYNLKKYKEAITHLEKFSSEDELLNTVAIGAIGDSFAELGQNDQALSFYTKAFSNSENEVLKPVYLLKAGQVALVLKDKATALKHFTMIKESYKSSQEASEIDAFIGLAL